MSLITHSFNHYIIYIRYKLYLLAYIYIYLYIYIYIHTYIYNNEKRDPPFKFRIKFQMRNCIEI